MLKDSKELDAVQEEYEALFTEMREVAETLDREQLKHIIAVMKDIGGWNEPFINC